MKKVATITNWFLRGALFAIILFMISIPIVNDFYAKQVKNQLKEIPLPEKTEYIEAISRADKMTGNGNGMQYFGAILIKSELSLEELDSYYTTYRKNEWDCIVEIQEGQNIACIEHGILSFETDLSVEGQYYIIYSWGKGNELFAQLDIRGH